MINFDSSDNIRNIFALFVGIDEYNQNGINNLAGCLNDVDGMELFVDSYCGKNNNIQAHKRILKNKDATRKNIIKAFEIFKEAQQNDTCLFYFSGHGARIDAPKEFWNESDGMIEAIVCFKDGSDNLLVDKELSYLISEATKDKDIHFVVITDSCHSMSNTKAITNETIRSASFNFKNIKIDDYLGRKYYSEIKSENSEVIRLSAPMGKHFKLSACTKNELAKEKPLGEIGKVSGIFTHALFNILTTNGGNLSYSNLINKIRIKVQSISKDQSPQLELIKLHSIEQDALFFNGILAKEKPVFQISYENQISKWVLNIGAIYGLKANDIVVILEGNQPVLIEQVEQNRSILELDFNKFYNYNRKEIYDCTILFKSRKKLNLTFSDDSEKKTKNIKKILDGNFSIEMTSNKGVDYVIHAKNDFFKLTYPNQDKAVFSRVEGLNDSSGKVFIKLIERVADWHHILSISNELSTIPEDAIEIGLSFLDKPYIYDHPDMDRSPNIIKNWKKDNVFRYIFDDSHPKGPWHPPYFRLSITNKSFGTAYWISVLYCGTWYKLDNNRKNITSTSYSITNKFLNKALLNPTKTIKIVDEVNNRNSKYIYESIELSILDDYFDNGLNEIKDIIKIFVSTEEIDTSFLNLEGIPIDITELESLNEKPAGKGAHQLPISDWRTFEIPITIVRPRDLGMLNKNQDKSLGGITLIGHPMVTAKIIVSTMEEFIRSTEIIVMEEFICSTEVIVNEKKEYMIRPEMFFEGEDIQILMLSDGLGNVEGCSVIELYRAEFIQLKEIEPFKIKIDKEMIDESYDLFLISYSSEKRAYIPLGIKNKDQEIEYKFIPPNTPSLIEGLGSSIKLFFLKAKKGINIDRKYFI